MLQQGGSYSPKLKCMTPDVSNELSPTYLLKLKFITPNVANYFPPTHQQEGSLMNSNSSALLQMLETQKLKCITPFVANDFSPAH